jgi:hypothetical protein
MTLGDFAERRAIQGAAKASNQVGCRVADTNPRHGLLFVIPPHEDGGRVKREAEPRVALVSPLLGRTKMARDRDVSRDQNLRGFC